MIHWMWWLRSSEFPRNLPITYKTATQLKNMDIMRQMEDIWSVVGITKWGSEMNIFIKKYRLWCYHHIGQGKINSFYWSFTATKWLYDRAQRPTLTLHHLLTNGIYSRKHEHICSLSIIYQSWDDTGMWKSVSWKTMNHLLCAVNTTVAAVLATHWTKSWCALVLT